MGGSAILWIVAALPVALSDPKLTFELTAGVSGSKQASGSTTSTAVPTTLKAGGNVVLMEGRDLHLEGTQIDAKGNVDSHAKRNILIESAVSTVPS